MKLSFLLEEEQSRKDLLMWQESFIDLFPSLDIGLDNKELHGLVKGNVITVSRNGKELFYVDTSRARGGFTAVMTIYGEYINPYSVQTKDYEHEFKTLLYLYDIARKLRNLNGKADIHIGRKNVDTFVISLAVKGQGGFGNYMLVEYKPNVSTFYVKLEHSLRNKEQLASTKDDSKIVDIVDKLFKERIVKG